MSAPTYSAVHSALRRTRGRAAEHACHWCGRRASSWSCLCEAADTLVGTNASGRRVTYSPRLADYVPACSSCHRRYDDERARRARATAHLAVSPLPAKRSRRTVDAANGAEPPALFALVDGAWSLNPR